MSENNGDVVEGGISNSAIGINKGSYFQKVETINDLTIDGSGKLKIENVTQANITANQEDGVVVEQHLHFHLSENADLTQLEPILERLSAKSIKLVLPKLETKQEE